MKNDISYIMEHSINPLSGHRKYLKALPIHPGGLDLKIGLFG
jgi:hypothetical protein